LEVLEWLGTSAPEKATELTGRLDLTEERLEHWREVITHIYLPGDPPDGPIGLIEQFEGYYQRKYVHLPDLEPRTKSVQELYGIEGAAELQVIKQPDVLMLQYLLRGQYSDEQVKVNYDYYTPRTDHTFGSSLGPSIQAIMACEVGLPDEGYEHFIRAARADLRDIRGNAGDGIHAASAAGTWQVLVFGFGGLKVRRDGWSYRPRLPRHWKRLAFRFFYRGELQQVDIRQVAEAQPGH
jgi:kojibiose phosphorylase